MNRIFALVLLTLTCRAGIPFTNLGFEDPVLTGIRGYPPPSANFAMGPAAELVRGWTLFQEGQKYDGLVGYTPGIPPGPGGPGIPGGGVGPGVHFALWMVNEPTVIDKYSLLIAGGPIIGGQPPNYQPVAMEQRGTIPPDAMLLLIAGQSPKLTLDGQAVPLTIWDRETKGYEISEFAGREVTLRFDFNAFGGFDILGFRAIPEPSTWALLLVGAAVGCMGWRRSR